jgi:alpha-L-fucosidase
MALHRAHVSASPFRWALLLWCALPALCVAPPDARLARYNEWKFGMFIHWGPYSLASVEASWPIMRPDNRWHPITEAEYRALPARFNPQRFDPHAFVRLAKEAGQRYMVFTAKHHDGFCMFDSAYTNYKITNTPYRNDIVAELSQACRSEGMPLGFYYSPPDMNHPGYRDTTKPSSQNWEGEPWRPEWPLYLDYMELQLTELLTRYGPVALVWFDGLRHQEKYNGRRFARLIHELQPDALINNRIGIAGDFDTPEQYTPQGIPTRRTPVMRGAADEGPPASAAIPPEEEFRPWETCMTINRTWAYNQYDRDFKSTQQLIRTLVDVASKGGNFLLNVGPGPDGAIQPEFVERLRGMGAWLKVNGAAIYGSTYGPLQNQAWGRSTRRGKTVYLHVFNWPHGPLEISGLRMRVVSVKLLAGGQAVRFSQQGEHLRIEVPPAAPDPNVTVLALETRNGNPDVRTEP